MNLPPAAPTVNPAPTRAVAIVSEAMRLPLKTRRAVAGYCYALGKRPVDHPANIVYNDVLAVPTCAVFLRDVLGRAASESAYDFLGLRERSVPTADLREAGYDVPPGTARLRWVTFRSPTDRAVYAEVHDMLAALGSDAPHPEEDQTPWLPFEPSHLPDTNPGGKHRAPTRCPFHDDRKASATIFAPVDRPHSPGTRGYGAGVCHACVGPDGRPLHFCWRVAPDGRALARVARAQRETSNDWSRVVRGFSAGKHNARPVGRAPAPPGVAARVRGAALAVSLRSSARGGSWHGRASTSCLAGGDVLVSIVRSERTADYANIRPRASLYEFEHAARREADPGRPGNADVHDRLVRVQPQFSTYYEPAPWGWVASGWVDAGVQNVLLDLDGLWLGPGAVARRWADAVVGIVSRDARCSGRVTVVRTSSHGAQVIVELARPVAGNLPGSAWWSSGGARAWYRRLGDRVLAAARAAGAEGGAVDWSAFAPGRLARRPGWRVAKDGTTYRSHLLAAVTTLAARTTR